MEASRYNNTEVVRILINAGADIQARSNHGETAFSLSRNHEISAILNEARAKADLVNSGSVTPLMQAVGSGDVVRVLELVVAGTDVNEKSGMFHGGKTPLMLAVRSRKTSAVMVDILLEAGADVNSQDAGGKTVLFHAVSIGHKAKESDMEVVKKLITAGAKVNMKDWSGRTPLMSAAAYWPPAVPVLLEAGADVNARTLRRQTALTLAAAKGKAESVRRLLNAGAEINARGRGGATALFQAVSYGRLDVVKILLQAGADTSIKDYRRMTVLGLARKKEKERVYQASDIVKLLEAVGAKEY
jgi:ankyrin repeat protein